MAYNRILIKDGNSFSESFTAKLLTAVKPGTLVKKNANGEFTTAGANDDKERLYVLSNRAGLGEVVDTTYEANATAQAYEVLPNRTVQIRGGAGTFTQGQAVTLADGGKVTTTVGDDQRIIGHVDYTSTITDNGLVEVRLGQGAIG